MRGWTALSKALCLSARASVSASGLSRSHWSVSSACLVRSSFSGKSSSSAVRCAAWAADSKSLRAATFSKRALSLLAWASASATRRSMSFLASLPPALSAVIVTELERPVAWSAARTCKMPLASTSNVTSTRGTPRGAGGKPESSKLPNKRLSLVRARSPSKTLMSTPGWLFSFVVNVRALVAGMVVLRSMSRVITPPAVSMPSDRGVTSSSTRSAP
mmetsp:Transcript_1144/g.3306  ORF Transcript_1144/g.3306 Transcript_1144/m.3306 type:complete len:217 (-) Transcript_1144:1273-1923(-)